MLSINPADLTPVQVQAYLQGAVGPRPIVFASTVDEEGNPNLSPFSFFNLFSSNPPILVFSPARRVRNNTVKHTLLNCETTKEVVVNIANYDMVQQLSLSSTEYGGLELNKLKKLKGDKLGFPSSSTVLAKAIGRGPTAPCKYA